MTTQFNLTIYNNVDLKSHVTLSGFVGCNIVHLIIENKETNSKLNVELSASELVVAATRIAAGPDGLISFPEHKKK